MKVKLLGIFREILHSPEREFDDLEILRLAREELARRGYDAELVQPEELLKQSEKYEKFFPDLVFAMCEREQILDLLQKWQSKGITIVNTPQAVLNTYRHRMIPLLQSNGAIIPESRLILTQDLFVLDFLMNKPYKEVWVKRGDVHNTQKGDVFLAKSIQEIQESFRSFHARGIRQMVLQENIVGDLIKFYGIGNPSKKLVWFKWFYHKGQDLKKYSFSESELQKITQFAARNLGLEIFGGDAVVNAEGKIALIDINAWPSFALFREEACKIIAQYLISKITEKALV